MRLPFGYSIKLVKTISKKSIIHLDKNGMINSEGTPVEIEPITALHPKFKSLVEYGFTIDGQDYYQMKSIVDMPALRYMKIEEFIRDAEMRISSKELTELMEDQIAFINKGEMTNVAAIAMGIIHRLGQFMDTDTFYRLFSCAFFTLDEQLNDYDYTIGDKKIEAFKSEKASAFFFRKPIKEYLPQVNISKDDMNTYLKLTKANNEFLNEIKEKAKKLKSSSTTTDK